jgi:UDP-N-acetylglucosamine enolpyruvyl transferase
MNISVLKHRASPSLLNTLLTTGTVHLKYVPNLIAVQFLLFIKSQFSLSPQSILHLNQYKHGRVRLWTLAHFQKARSGFE